MDKTRTATCVSCEGIFLKSDLSDDGRCSRCVVEDRKPNRKRESNWGSTVKGDELG